MSITEISPDYSVSPQIRTEDVAEIAGLGFRSIMCNRPEGETDDQTPAAEIEAEAKRLGLGFAHVPVVSGQISSQDVEDFRSALDRLEGPVLAYCRSGTRSQNLFALSRPKG